MKCNQTGKLFRVKVTTLSRNDDDDLTMDDLVEGSQLLLTMSGKSYPVTVLRVIPALTDVTAESKSYYFCTVRIIIIHKLNCRTLILHDHST